MVKNCQALITKSAFVKLFNESFPIIRGEKNKAKMKINVNYMIYAFCVLSETNLQEKLSLFDIFDPAPAIWI